MNSSINPSPALNKELLQFTRPWPLSLPPEPKSEAVRDASPKVRILVAEDDMVSRTLICAWLTRWGYEVIAMENGTDAMAVLRSPNAPSLAILDWMMPGMDGTEICRRVREVNRAVYLILLSALDSKAHIVDGLSAGADDYLGKPFDPEELRARILVGLRVMNLQKALADRLKISEGARGLGQEARPLTI